MKSFQAILQQCGAYYQSGDSFYQRLWHQRLSQIGFRVISVTKLPYHELWDIRLYGTLTSESYLLITKPVPKRYASSNDLLVKQFQSEIQEIAKDLGQPIRRDCIQVDRKGAYLPCNHHLALGQTGAVGQAGEKGRGVFVFDPSLAAEKSQLIPMLPLVVNPMLAQKAEAAFDSEQQLFEIKWDGIRCLAFIEGGRVRLQSRQLTEITFQFPELACLAGLPSGTVLDGELVVLWQAKPSLRAVQQRALLQNRQRILGSSRSAPVTYMVFDLLYLKGKPLLASPLSLRREALQNLFQQVSLPGVLVPPGIVRYGRQMFDQVIRLGLEGIMAKRLDGIYLPGKRSRHWLKIKPQQLPRSSW